MTIHKRSIPTATEALLPTAYKLFIPRELEEEPARAIWTKLRSIEGNVLADPFALPAVSTCFPGVVYQEVSLNGDDELDIIVKALEELIQEDPDIEPFLEDAWVELWVPDSLQDDVVHDVTDLTQQD